MRHDFAEGKYTVINDNGKLTALRHGQPWARDLVGDNLVYWMLVEVDRLKEELARAQSAPQPVNPPTHKFGLYLTHNEHRNLHQSLGDFISVRDLAEDFASHEEMSAALAADECWVLQWYPDTSNGFYRVAASSLERVLQLADAVVQEGD